MGTEDRQLGKFEQNVETIARNTEKLMEVIYEREGILERNIRMETAIHQLQKDFCEMLAQGKEEASRTAKKLETIATGMVDIKSSFSEHASNKDVHTLRGLVLHKIRDVLITTVVGFVALHSMIPPTLTVYDLFKKLLGL